MKIHKRLTPPLDKPLPVSAHKSAVSSMLKARDALLRGAVLKQSSKMALLCGAIMCMRRITFEIDADDQIRLLKKTQTLLFSLLAMAEDPGSYDTDYVDNDQGDKGEEGEEGEGGEGGESTGQSDQGAAGDDGRPNKRRRMRMREETQLIASWQSRSLAERIEMVGQAQSSSSWDTTLRSDEAVSNAALKEARYVKDESAMQQMGMLSDVFLRTSASAMMNSLINNAARPSRRSTNEDPLSFLTLDTIGILNASNDMQYEKLMALADAAESEAGQAILRDMILSFKLPTKAVGVRKCVCLTREANAFATKQYPEILNGAHEAAMRGAIWSFESDPDPIHKMSALLSGLALVIPKQKDDIRKGCAFGGRVVLPFIDTPPIAPSISRLGLVSDTGDWAVYTTDKIGTPKVTFKKTGYTGLCECVLLLSKSLLQ